MTSGGDDLTSKVYQTMEKHKEVFFVVLLHPPTGGNSSPPPGTTDPDQLVTCDLMDGRDAFLTMARERHWEFSSLRRAKFSTMAMLYELHNQSSDRFVYNCNSCHMDVETRYHCKECDVSCLSRGLNFFFFNFMAHNTTSWTYMYNELAYSIFWLDVYVCNCFYMLCFFVAGF